MKYTRRKMRRLILPPNGRRGEAVVSEVKVGPIDSLRSVIQTAQTGFPFSVLPGRYKRLLIGGVLQMSNTRMEQLTNMEFVRQAKGRVLLAGLGLGFVLTKILKKKEVESVTVVEKSRDCIRLVGPHFACKKLKIVRGDIREWRLVVDQMYETIYFDIWPTVDSSNLTEMAKLHRLFKRYLAPGGWMGSWSRAELRRLKRRGF